MQYAVINQPKRDAKVRTSRAHIHGARVARLILTIWFGVVFLAVAVAPAQSVGQPDPTFAEFEEPLPEVSPYHQERNRRAAREQQDRFRLRVAIPDAVGEDVEAAFAASQGTGQSRISTTATQPAVVQPLLFRWILLVAAVLLLAGMMAIRKFAPRLLPNLIPQLDLLEPAHTRAAHFSTKFRAEEEGATAFFTAFQAGPPTVPQPAALAASSPESGSIGAANNNGFPVENRAVQEFQTKAAKLILTQRNLLQEINRAADAAGRHKMLAALRWEMHVLKSEADLPELLPVWQIAFALEGLLKQLTDKLGNVTASALRTVAGGVDLLDDLCRSGLNPSRLTARPIKLLVVDNNSISRKAISRALKRAFNPPDLAEDAETALTLVAAQAYDVIFFDVQMPGADGFEFCSRIHETVPNYTTPVVFVTDQSDFDVRAQSTLNGGNDLIGKPFLTFEITLKAFTAALRGRLPPCAQGAGASRDADESDGLAPAFANTRPAVAEEAVFPEPFTDSARVSQTLAEASRLNAESSTLAREPLPDELATACLTRASAEFGPVRDLFQAVFQTADPEARQGMLAEAYLRIHSFTPKANFATVHPVLLMSAALEGLLRKLLENPQNSTTSTLITVAAGLELLVDLCVSGLKSDLVTNPPIRILVVDDDPVARRAVTYALQMAFEKPESAASGAAALALAAEKPYDVIFLDVQMPGMDGFTVCSKIHETVLNRATPVVFVAGQSDFNVRTQMSRSGGSDFVSKPILISEITVKALTFALRGRIEKQETVRN